ncbi:3-ketosteroid-9-alpha-monooxygenase, oxygenase component [BD1-7 clade bacterium]|uniref:cholesterol 7-desaturase n=1 Tax=BD1-7 clade bacterium TaxID=2029982 RepID=A0A5S9QJX0_9GAMM|nr:3-ketosteroid-9-alpha-monooxygenase, oxygenase component [BD1-7 clade bacterium]CAA0120657.1 3-ketosteroid-9-alpha-monooxygenase, oxygenase component [BD1-7 clade bacterium]
MSRFPMPMPYGWFHVSYSDELAIGQSKAVRYFGKDLVLFRTESGKAVLLDAYCPHLGAHLGHGINAEAGQGGRIEGETIVCPFHAWKFTEEGQVSEIPYAKNIPPKVKNQQCLKSWPVTEVNQVIFAWYHPEDKVPEYAVEQIAELADGTNWGRLDKHRWIVKTHIQEISENGADPAHFKYVHGTATFPDTEISFDGRKRFGTFRAKLDTPRGQINGCIDSVSNGPGQGFVRYTGICETVQLGHVTPIDNDTCEINFAFSQKKVNGETPKGGVNQAIIMDICKQLEEDSPIWEHKVYRPLPVLCDGDGPIARFRRWMQQFYIGYEEIEG